jgi:nucleoside phosphorylase
LSRGNIKRVALGAVILCVDAVERKGGNHIDICTQAAKKKKKWFENMILKKIIWIACSGVLVLLLAGVGILIFCQHAQQVRQEEILQAAKIQYEQTRALANENAIRVQDKIAEAQAFLTSNPEVANPSCLDNLSAALEKIVLPGFEVKMPNAVLNYQQKTDEYGLFDSSWAEGIILSIEDIMQEIRESVEQKKMEEAEQKAREAVEQKAREKAEKRAREAAEQKAAEQKAREAAEKKRQQEKASASNTPASAKQPQYVGVIAYASNYIGRTDFSCDELVSNALADMGFPYMLVTLTQNATNIKKENQRYVRYKSLFPEVSITEMRAGDILQSAGHVEIYLGNGRSIHGGYGPNHTTVVIANRTRTITNVYRPGT